MSGRTIIVLPLAHPAILLPTGLMAGVASLGAGVALGVKQLVESRIAAAHRQREREKAVGDAWRAFERQQREYAAMYQTAEQAVQASEKTLAALQLAIAGAQRTQQKIAVMMLDLDRFKKVNDSMGHSTGDQLLRSVADRLETLMRKSDTVARLGGDEFMLLCPEIPRAEVASEIARRVLDAFQKAFEVGEKKIHITASIGISIYPDDGGDPDSLTKKADTAMYAVKASGRNNIRHYSPEMKTLEFE